MATPGYPGTGVRGCAARKYPGGVLCCSSTSGQSRAVVASVEQWWRSICAVPSEHMPFVPRLSIAKVGGVRPLLELARTGTKQMREQAVWALWRASFTVEQKEAIMETEALPLLVEGTSAWKSNTAGEAATAVLRSLSATSSHRPALVDAGAIPALIETVRSGNAGAKRAARITLANLAEGNPSNVALMLENGWNQGAPRSTRSRALARAHSHARTSLPHASER